jgi:hypothetical protein
MMTGLNAPHVFTVPSEHDSTDAGQKYRQAFGAGTRGDGWYSFDVAGVHIIGVVNTLNLKKLGHLGTDQLEFIEKDVAPLSSNNPIAVFSHIPLFAMYPDWGWGTDDAAQALSYLKRFASVTCLNGDVHQLFSKTEGNVTFYTGTGADLTLETADASPFAMNSLRSPLSWHWRDGHAASLSPTSQSQRHSSPDSSHGT